MIANSKIEIELTREECEKLLTILAKEKEEAVKRAERCCHLMNNILNKMNEREDLSPMPKPFTKGPHFP